MEQVYYTENRKTHLTNYKETILKISEEGTCPGCGYSHRHILPEHLKRLNILEEIRDPFWSQCDEKTLHRCFSHLNSSQAACFNLFFSLLHPDPKLVHLMDVLGLPVEPETMLNGQFEKVLDDGTNVDFYVESSSGNRLLIEVKYTESGFGAANINEKNSERTTAAYVAKYHDKYEKPLDKVLKRKLDIDGSKEDRDLFLREYQFFRYLAQLDGSTTLCFIMPLDNFDLCVKAASLVAEWLHEDLRDRVRFVPMERVVHRLNLHSSLRELQPVYRSFREKYLGDPSPKFLLLDAGITDAFDAIGWPITCSEEEINRPGSETEETLTVEEVEKLLTIMSEADADAQPGQGDGMPFPLTEEGLREAARAVREAIHEKYGSRNLPDQPQENH